jgi:hypothetical protein
MATCQGCGVDIVGGAAECEYCGAAVDLPKERPYPRGDCVGRETAPGTLFLNAFYLQSQINGMIDARLLAVSP